MSSGLLDAASDALAEGADDDAPEAAAGRRPRFEMRAEARKAATRGGGAKLGLATTQGAIGGVKLYAATHAAKEGARATLCAARLPESSPLSLGRAHTRARASRVCAAQKTTGT